MITSSVAIDNYYTSVCNDYIIDIDTYQGVVNCQSIDYWLTSYFILSSVIADWLASSQCIYVKNLIEIV